MISSRALVALGAALLLGGCSSWRDSSEPFLGILSPYRIDVQQGNVVTQDQLVRLKPGMTKLQVRDVLGTPLVTDAFHTDRWDYIFTLRQGNKPMLRRSVVLTFNGDVLKNIEAPELPTEQQFVDSIARRGRIVAAADLELSPEQIKALPVPAKVAPAAPPPDPSLSTTPRTYPPLEQ